MGRWVEREIVGGGQTSEWEIVHGEACDLPTVQVLDTTGQTVAASYVAAWPGDGTVKASGARSPVINASRSGSASGRTKMGVRMMERIPHCLRPLLREH